MLKGSRLPRYECNACGREFAARNGYARCPHCGHRPYTYGHRLVSLGHDGTVQTFNPKRRGDY